MQRNTNLQLDLYKSRERERRLEKIIYVIGSYLAQAQRKERRTTFNNVNLVSELPYLLPPEDEEVTPESFKHFKPTEVEEYPDGLPF